MNAYRPRQTKERSEGSQRRSCTRANMYNKSIRASKRYKRLRGRSMMGALLANPCPPFEYASYPVGLGPTSNSLPPFPNKHRTSDRVKIRRRVRAMRVQWRRCGDRSWGVVHFYQGADSVRAARVLRSNRVVFGKDNGRVISA